jgi:DNA-binding NtrC family response regulator
VAFFEVRDPHLSTAMPRQRLLPAKLNFCLIFVTLCDRLLIPDKRWGLVHIFVVDDQKIVADSMAAVLSIHGHQTSAFYSAYDALAHAREHTPDLLVSDVHMMGMNGIELAIRFTEEMPRCKVLLMSGVAATTNLLRDAEAKGYRFEVLAKPTTPQDLIAKVESMFVGENR